MPTEKNKKTSSAKHLKPKSTSRRVANNKEPRSLHKAPVAASIKTKKTTRAHLWLANYARRVSLYGGVVVVALWTLIRHITNGVNFDVVGQIGVAQQWAHGQMSGTQLGATSYLLKMPVYFLINILGFLSPMNRLLLAALIFNIATFILLFILYEKIMNLYQIKSRSWLYASMAWLATIAGNVFWVDYANSRNLETVGGILFVYLVLKYLKNSRLKTLSLLVIIGSFAFFADPIQLYVCGLGTCIFVITRAVFTRSKLKAAQALAIIGATAVGYGFSQILFFLARKLLHVTFLAAPNSRPILSANYLINTLHGLEINTLKIFGANFLKRPYSFNSIREAINAVVLLVLIIIIVRSVIKKRSSAAFGLALLTIIVNYLVYIVSGQVLYWETSRYLIMVPLLLIILLITGKDSFSRKFRIKLQYLWWLASVACAVILIGALAYSWPTRHSKDVHIQALSSFMDQHSFGFALSSRDVGITSTYFSNGDNSVLPMSCQADHALHPTDLFYDKAAFNGIDGYQRIVPIIVPSGGIKFGGNICSSNDIFRQFGAPKKLIDVPEVGLAAVYSASRIKLLANLGEITGQRPAIKASKALPELIKSDILTPAATIPKLEACTNGTDDIVVAHPDDDILFMNPDLLNELPTKCVRTVYVTAGDSGRARDYWINRQHGIEAAYASMLGLPNDWTDSSAVIEGQSFLARTLNGRPSLSLVFLQLPDGGPGGQGFAATSNMSLSQLSIATATSIHTVDGSTSYTYNDLAKIVGIIIATDKPNKILTHVGSGPLSIGDHSDHRAVGLLTIHARTLAKSNATLVQYVGYPVNNLPPNLSSEVSTQKRNIFNIYASQDAVICVFNRGCSIENTFGKYFSRSYRLDKL